MDIFNICHKTKKKKFLSQDIQKLFPKQTQADRHTDDQRRYQPHMRMIAHMYVKRSCTKTAHEADRCALLRLKKSFPYSTYIFIFSGWDDGVSQVSSVLFQYLQRLFPKYSTNLLSDGPNTKVISLMLSFVSDESWSESKTYLHSRLCIW